MRIHSPVASSAMRPMRSPAALCAEPFCVAETRRPATAAAIGMIRPAAARPTPDRRRTAIRDAHHVLGALDALRLAQLSGESVAALASLRGAIAAEPAFSGDPALDEIVDMIILRAAVELAKAQQRSRSKDAVDRFD